MLNEVTKLVLPLLIIGGVLIVGSIAAYKSSDSLKTIVYDLTASDEQKTVDTGKDSLALKKDVESYAKHDRGFLHNGYAYLFGESFYAEVFGDKAPPTPILTGEEKQTLGGHRTQTLTHAKTGGLQDG